MRRRSCAGVSSATRCPVRTSPPNNLSTTCAAATRISSRTWKSPSGLRSNADFGAGPGEPMQLSALFSPLADTQAEWLIVPTCEGEEVGGALAPLDARLGGVLTRLRQRGDVAGKRTELTP